MIRFRYRFATFQVNLTKFFQRRKNGLVHFNNDNFHFRCHLANVYPVRRVLVLIPIMGMEPRCVLWAGYFGVLLMYGLLGCQERPQLHLSHFYLGLVQGLSAVIAFSKPDVRLLSCRT